MHYHEIINEAIIFDYSDYGYWVTPSGDAIVVPDSSHYKILLRHYEGKARFGQDRYENVIAEGWCWVFVSGAFVCFIEPSALTRQSATTLQRIINQYDDFGDYRFVFNHQKRDCATPMEAKSFLRSLLAP